MAGKSLMNRPGSGAEKGMRPDRRWIWTCGVLAALCLGSGLPGPAAAELEVSGGMEYFTVQTYARDPAGYYFQTLIQSTLATLGLGYRLGPLKVRAAGSLSDWNAGGKWTGSDIVTLDLEPYYLWAWQQKLTLEVGVNVWGGWDVGVGYEDHALRHYNGSEALTFLQYRLRSAEAFVDYRLLQTENLQVQAAVAYAPLAFIEVYQNTTIERDVEGIHVYDTAGAGSRWRGRLAMHYRDSAGWGLDFSYTAGFARFQEPRNLSEFSLRFGSLTGFFTLLF